MTINKNSVEQINVALLDMDKKLKSAISNGTSASDFKNLEASVDSIKRTLNEAKTGLEPGKTYNINISGNAATADKATTATIAEKATNANHAETAATAEAATNADHATEADHATNATTAETATKVSNALTINGKTYNGSTAVDAGVQTVANGGTGVTTQADINKAFIGNLDVGNSDVTDGTEFVSSWASDNGFAETAEGANTPYKRQFIKVWNYIKDKIASVLGLTKDAYGGKSALSSFLSGYTSSRPTSGNIVPKDASEYGGMRKDVVTSSMTDSGRPGQDGHLLTMFWDSNGRWDTQLFVSNEAPQTVKVRYKDNVTDYGPWVDVITSNNIGSQSVARAGTAGTADYARNMYHQDLDLSALDKTKFYPLVCASYQNFTEVAICSESRMGHYEYNQNRIHFDISTQGWSDLPYTLNIREYACYDNSEITIGCIGRGIHNGAWAIWLRGGLHYTCWSRDGDLTLHTSDYTWSDETYTVGTNYYGGSNTNVEVWFIPQSTITNGAYSTRGITAPGIRANYSMVIPIGAPSSLEDGCIWIER